MAKERGNIEDDPNIKSYIDDALGVTDNGDNGDNGAEGNTDTGATDNTDNKQAQTPQDKQASGDQGQGATKQDSGSGKPDGQQKQDDKKPTQEVALRPGDMKLPDGTVIKGGAERRWYDNMRIARDQANAFENKVKTQDQTIQQLQQQIETHKTALQAAGTSDPQQLSDSLRLMNDLRANPIGTLQSLLAELAASGVDLSGVVKGLDVKAMQAMLDQRGVGNPQQQQQQQVDPKAAAQAEARDFITAHPDALTHQDVLIGLAKTNPNMSLEQIYWELRTHAANNGYDWSKSLSEQYQSRQQQQQQQQGQRKPMPNGNGASSDQLNDAGDVLRSNGGGADESLDSIIRSSIKETGYTYRK